MHRFALVLLIVAAADLRAQDVSVDVATQKPPYYVGEPVVLQFSVEGFDQQPEPTCTMETPDGQPLANLRGQLAGTNASVFSQIIQRGGRIVRSNRITYRINYTVTADEPGDYQVGPFIIQQGNKTARVEALRMTFQDVPVEPNMQIRLLLPDQPVYPDQRVPVGIEWWYAGDFDKVLQLSIYSPVFDQFRFAPDEQPSRRSAQLPISTRDGTLQLAAATRQERLDGRQYLVVSATRILIPDRVGEYPLAPITATLRKAISWANSRSLFDDPDDFGFGGSLLRDLVDGRRRPAQTELARAVGQPQTLVVRPFPEQNRPESFAGAVGSGFAVDVTADRTVVRVGDPIGLQISVRGQGNIQNVSLPPLSADQGMDPQQFRLPEGDIPGTLTGDEKSFHVSVRVLDETVTEVPALAYSWFNPQTRRYETARSQPIALRVMPAQIVSADDVIRNQSAAPPDSTAGKAADLGSGSEVSRAQGRTFSLSGADLAIVANPALVLKDFDQSQRRSAWLRTGMYLVGILSIVIAWIDQRRRHADPAVAKRRRLLRDQRATIARAAQLPRKQAAEEIAAAIRRLVAEVPDVDRSLAQAVVADCEAIVYAPGNSDEQRLNTSLVDRAKQVAEI